MTDHDQIAQRFVDGLTSKQIADLAARLLARLPEEERTRFIDEQAPDVAAVLRHSESLPLDGDEPVVSESDAKFAQEFRLILERLHGFIFELGDEDGEYVYQGRNWEPPDFDAYQLAKDIDSCAEELLPLLEKAKELELADEYLFIDICQVILDGIAMYPEYIYTEDGVELEPTTTRCMLKWFDLHAASEDDFLDSLIGFESEMGLVMPDTGTMMSYLLADSTKERRGKLYAAFEERRKSDPWLREHSGVPKSLWYEIRYALVQEFSPDDCRSIAEASLSKDWTRGPELIAAAMADDDSAQAIDLCRRTMDAYVASSFSRNASFDPGTSVLFGHWDHADDSTVVKVLGTWKELAGAAGDLELAQLLGVQKALLVSTKDWTLVRDVFRQADSADTSALFAAWKEQTIKAQCNDTFGGSRPDTTWVEWLIDAGLKGELDAFSGKALAWLGEKLQIKKSGFGNPLSYLQRQPPQLSLAADLVALHNCPEYSRLTTLLQANYKLSDCPSRRKWLGKTDVSRLAAAAVEFLRGNMDKLIPSPLNTDYKLAAAWLAAAVELTPELAQSVLQRWKVDHKRRRNLWRDLRAAGVDV